MLDGSQSRANIQQYGHHAGTQNYSNDDRDSKSRDQKADGFRVLLLRILDGAQGRLLLGLNLPDHLEGEIRHGRFIIVGGRDNCLDSICQSCRGGGGEKGNNSAG